MTLPLFLGLIFIAAIITLIVTRVIRPVRSVRLNPEAEHSARSVALLSTARNSLAIAVGLAATIALSVASVYLVNDLGRLQLCIVILAAAAAILVVLVLPSVEFWEPKGTRSAELSPRRPRDFARLWVLVLPLASAGALVLTLVLCAFAAEPDGRSIGHSYGAIASGTASPYPGAYYGVPIAASLLVHRDGEDAGAADDQMVDLATARAQRD